MSVLAAVADRLTQPPRASLQGLDSLAQILTERSQLAADSVFVIPDGERITGGESGTAYFEQLVDVGVAVVVMAMTGGVANRAGERLEELKEFVKAQLMGWGCPASRSPAEYRGATPLPIAPGRVAMMLRFTVPTRVRVTRTGAPDA